MLKGPKNLLAAIAVGGALAGAALAQPPAAKIDWAVGPDLSDIYEVYPIEAGLKRISAQVLLRCEGAADGRLVNCKVAAEEPANMGFGAAALRLAAEYRLKPGAQRPAFDIPFEFFIPPTATAEDLELPILVRTEDAAQTWEAWPPEARALGLTAVVSLRCVVAEDGRLRDCIVERESHPNLGFGPAAVELAGLRRYIPGHRDGKPTPVSTPVSVAFNCNSRCTPLKVSSLKQPLAVRVPWAKAPLAADVAAVYPPEAARTKVKGKVILHCDLRGNGTLRDCDASVEEPAGQGFAEAALKLVPKFQAPTGRGPSLAGAKVFIPFSFTGDPMDTGAPQWNGMPSRAEFAAALPPQAREKGVEGTVTMDCEVSATGQLTGCKVQAETPPGMGFGAAALSLQPKFVMTLWSVDGQPTVGAKVRAPLAFDPPQQAATGGARIPEVTNPEWARRPSPIDLANAYPERALRNSQNGSARIRCTVLPNGSVTGCRIVAENPKNYGFGDAAIRLSRYFVMKPMMVDGRPVMPSGAEVEFPIGFRVQ